MREALRLRYVRGLSCEEIARRKGLTLMAVKTRLFRARRRLRAAMTPSEECAAQPQARAKKEKVACVFIRPR